jgi:hypothetical protein
VIWGLLVLVLVPIVSPVIIGKVWHCYMLSSSGIKRFFSIDYCHFLGHLEYQE